MAGLDWTNEAFPVLQAVYAAMRANDVDPFTGVDQERINAQLGREAYDQTTAFALIYLIDSGFVRETLSTDQHYGPGHCVLADRGRQFVAGWPASPGDEALKNVAEELGRGPQA